MSMINFTAIPNVEEAMKHTRLMVIGPADQQTALQFLAQKRGDLVPQIRLRELADDDDLVSASMWSDCTAIPRAEKRTADGATIH
jgi:hypothetical protein